MDKITQTLDREKLKKKVQWRDESKFELFGSHRSNICERQNKGKDAGGVFDAICQGWWSNGADKVGD